MEILIRTRSDIEESERMMALVEGLEKAELCKLSTALLVTTEDEQVAVLLARYGSRLDEPVVPPAKNSRKGIGGRRKKVQEPVADTYVNPALANDVPWGAETRVEPVVSASPEPVSEPTADAEPEAVAVVKKKKTGCPTRGITPALENDLRNIVAEAGRKALHGARKNSDAGEGEGVRSVETTYTKLTTGAQISYLEMRSLLRERQVNARERFMSSSQGLMEVYDKGKKLILVRVAE